MAVMAVMAVMAGVSIVYHRGDPMALGAGPLPSPDPGEKPGRRAPVFPPD